jgi:hypothetical protein
MLFQVDMIVVFSPGININLNGHWPNGAIKPKWNGCGDVIGCGLLLYSANELYIFFTQNGIIMGQYPL